MPLMPCFKGDILDHQDSSANAIKAVLHFQYSSICRDQKQGNGQENYSMYRRLKEGGVSKPEDFISFCSLRTNSMDPKGEKLVTEIVYVHSKLMIVDDRATIIGSANINDRSQLGDRDSEVCMVYAIDAKNEFNRFLFMPVIINFRRRIQKLKNKTCDNELNLV